MRSSTLAASLVLAASAVTAFESTFPILAWSDIELSSLALLSPSHPSHAPAVFRAPTAQTPFPPPSSPSPSSDLCSLSSILLISAPGLHSSDLTLLPPSSAIRHASQSSQDKLEVPYVPIRKNGETAVKLVKNFVGECEAKVERAEERNLWSGGEKQGKSVRVEVVEGLDGWELTGGRARKERRNIVERIDAIVASHLASLPSNHLIILTSLPSLSTASAHKSPSTLAKRQFDSDSDRESNFDDSDSTDEASIDSDRESYDDDTDEDSSFTDYFRPIASVAGSSSKAFADNATSVFQPRPNGGLLSRYVFFTPALILCLLISIFILLPIAILSTSALTTTETVAGLESKMTGTVGLDPSKA